MIGWVRWLWVGVPGAVLCAAAPAAAQHQPDLSSAVADGADSVAQVMQNARRYAGRTRREDCLAAAAEAAAFGEIVVCGSRGNDQALPVPELYGPVAGSTDGAAVDPALPCGAGPTGCYEGIDMIRLGGSLAGVVALIFDPDRDLGEGEAIPKRFRGANR